jgi:hypothetical protein
MFVARKPHFEGWFRAPEPPAGLRVPRPEERGTSMASSEYYRRQSELCLQLALLQAELHSNLQMTFMLLELAKELRAKAGCDNAPSSPACVTRTMRPRSCDRDTKMH